MSGIICVHIGGCGISLGETFYDVISHEHGLTPDEYFIGNNPVQLQSLGVYYSIGKRIYAKAILVDTDTSTFNKNNCLTPYGQMFSPHNMINTTDDQGTGNNFAKGYITKGRQLLEPTIEAIRHEAEACDSLQGLQLCHSIGGGTGSGFTALLTENLLNDYLTKIICSYSVTPSSKTSNVVVEPYNALLSLPFIISNTNLTFMIDNEAIADINGKLYANPVQIRDMNYIVGHTMSGVTSSLRFPGQLNSSLRKIYTNMCPFPSLHLLLPGFSPIISPQNKPYTKITVDELVYQIFNSKNLLSSIDFRNGKILTLAAMFRGRISPKQVDASMKKARNKSLHFFCNWIPYSIKWGICDIAPMLIPKSVSFLVNTSAVNDSIKRIEKSAMAMLTRKAYLHWYTVEGLEEEQFNEAHQEVLNVLDAYDDMTGDIKVKNYLKKCLQAKCKIK